MIGPESKRYIEIPSIKKVEPWYIYWKFSLKSFMAVPVAMEVQKFLKMVVLYYLKHVNNRSTDHRPSTHYTGWSINTLRKLSE